MQNIIALDTEFERRYTYRPILSIVQLRQEGRDAVVYDVYKQKNESLVDLLELLADDNVIKIIHAARQDVEAIFYRFHISIQNIFDTQIAYKYLAHKNNIGYTAMVCNLLQQDITKDKKLQNSNWLKRPLTEQQISYAKQDVQYLHDAYYKMIHYFQKNQYAYQQFKTECMHIEDEKNYIFNPNHYWQTIKHKFINNSHYEIIKKMFILREKLAYKINIPREFVIKTSNLINFAHTGDIAYLQTHNKVKRNIFIETYCKS